MTWTTNAICDYSENGESIKGEKCYKKCVPSCMLQVGDFLLLHLLGQNMNMVVFGEILDELSRRLNDYMHNNVPTAPSTMEMSPIYPSKEKFPKETEA